MKVTELKQKKYKKLLEELKDFCEYGYCLEEETARTYMLFLVDALVKIERARGKKAAANEENHSKVNNNRFAGEKDRLENRAEDDYFEGKSLGEFEKEFERIFNQLKIQHTLDGKRKIPTEWIVWIQNTFNNYVARFEKRNPKTNTDFRNQVGWKDKKQTSNSGKYLPFEARK